MLFKIVKGKSEDVVNKIKGLYSDLILEFKEVEKEDGVYLIVRGDINKLDIDKLVDESFEIISKGDSPYYFASKEYMNNRLVKVNDLEIGNGDLTIIAGPCAAEKYNCLLETAKKVKELGAAIFRAGAYKPRTTPYNFQGIGLEGLKMLDAVRKEVEIPVLSEIMNVNDIELAEQYIDIIQVGTRNMTNVAFLKELGKTKLPILLKKGFSSTNEELIKAAEFIIANGNDNILLCERGIKTFETSTRYTLDLSTIPVIKSKSNLPIVIDPSHGTGRKELVLPMSKAAVLLGADCLEIEVHINPDDTIKPGDGKQTLDISEFKNLIDEVGVILNQNNRKWNK